MKRTPVDSSNLDSIGYDTGMRTLKIEFNTGSVYQYFDVPEEVYERLLDSASLGSYFHHYIRNKYMNAKVY